MFNLREDVGEETDVLCVKATGSDMALAEPAGLPAVRLDPLKKLRSRDTLSADTHWTSSTNTVFDGTYRHIHRAAKTREREDTAPQSG